jgi:DNA-binding NtrC family response regulator
VRQNDRREKFSLIRYAMHKKKILIAEDDPDIRELCREVLRVHDFDSIPSANGLVALETYRERHHEICLVLSDVTMPVMDGIELARNLFGIHAHANVILMSGYGLHRLIPEELRRLCSVIQKPFSPGRLIEAVRKCLNYDAEHYPAVA